MKISINLKAAVFLFDLNKSFYAVHRFADFIKVNVNFIGKIQTSLHPIITLIVNVVGLSIHHIITSFSSSYFEFYRLV